MIGGKLSRLILGLWAARLPNKRGSTPRVKSFVRRQGWPAAAPPRSHVQRADGGEARLKVPWGADTALLEHWRGTGAEGLRKRRDETGASPGMAQRIAGRAVHRICAIEALEEIAWVLGGSKGDDVGMGRTLMPGSSKVPLA